MGKLFQHKQKVEELKKTLLARKGRCSLAKVSSSNTMRDAQYKKEGQSLDMSAFNQVLEINLEKKTLTVEPKVTMEALFAETAPFGLVPKVLPEFKGITAGGAVNGAALESSSFRYGQFNDMCLEYEVLLGDGSLALISKENDPELFYGLSGSYGSLGVITSIKISLIASKPYVQLEYMPASSVDDAVIKMQTLAKDESVDFLEAIAYSKNQVAICIGRMVSKKSSLFDLSKPYSPWYYLHVNECLKKGVKEETLTLQDFLFRHDRAAFWMGGYALDYKILTRYILRTELLKGRSTPMKKASFLFRLLFGWIMDSKKLYKILHSGTEGWFKKHFCIQDYYLPAEKVESFTDHVFSTSGIEPLWLCPCLSTDTPQILSPHANHKQTLLFDVGVYGKPMQKTGEETVRDLDHLCYELGGKKMFYGYSGLNEEEFWQKYPQGTYQSLRKKYKAEDSFHVITEKVLK